MQGDEESPLKSPDCMKRIIVVFILNRDRSTWSESRLTWKRFRFCTVHKGNWPSKENFAKGAKSGYYSSFVKEKKHDYI